MQILSRILSSWIMASLQECYSRGGNSVWKKHNTLAPSDFRVGAKQSWHFRAEKDLSKTPEELLTHRSLVQPLSLTLLSLSAGEALHCAWDAISMFYLNLPRPEENLRLTHSLHRWRIHLKEAIKVCFSRKNSLSGRQKSTVPSFFIQGSFLGVSDLRKILPAHNLVFAFFIKVPPKNVQRTPWKSRAIALPQTA